MLVQLRFSPLSPQKKGMILKKERKGGFLCTSFFFVTPSFLLSLLFLLPHHVYLYGRLLAAAPFLPSH